LPPQRSWGSSPCGRRSHPTRARRQQRVLRAIAIALAIAFWLAASRARAAGETLEVSGGWDGVLAWTLLVSLLLVLAVRMCQMAYQEITRPEARRQERILASGAGVLGVIIGISSISAPVGAAVDQLGWIETTQTRMTTYGYNFFLEAFGACLIASVPWLRAIIARAGLNATSRHWRRLQPLRAALTAAVPESAFDLKVHTNGRRKTTLELHQTTVQIRDALLRLRPYSHCLDEVAAAAFISGHSVPAAQRAAALETLQLVHAVRVRAEGASPAELEPGAVVHSRSTNLDQEAGELLRLARWWPAAQAFDDNWTQTPERMSH
jgi:hypothetical protein